MAICFAALIICFFIIACQICLAVIEYYLVVTLASVLIPFGIASHTKFIAEKAIGAAIAVSVKLMVLSFIMGLAQPLIGQMHFTGSGDITLNQMISMLLVCGLLAYVVLRAPAVAADLLSGSPSLNAGAIGQSMVSGVSASSAPRPAPKLEARRSTTRSRKKCLGQRDAPQDVWGRWGSSGRRWRGRRRSPRPQPNASGGPGAGGGGRQNGGAGSTSSGSRRSEPQGLGRPSLASRHKFHLTGREPQ